MSLEFETETNFQDEAYQGKTFPSQYGTRGPHESDECTDIFCMIIFILYLVGMIGLVVFLYPKAHVGEMRSMLDSAGNKCGADKGFEDYKNLYMFKFTPPFRSVCVKECPKFDFNQIKFNSTGTATEAIEPVYFSNFSAAVKAEKDKAGGDKTPEETRRRMLVHTADTGAGAGAEGDKDKEVDSSIFEFDEKAAKGYYTKEQWNAYVNNYKMDCKTNKDVDSCSNNVAKKNYLYDSRGFYGGICTPVAPKITSKMGGFGDLSSALDDVKKARWAILGSILLTLIVSIIILFVTKIFIGCILWTLIVLTILFSFVVAVFCFVTLYFASQTDFIVKYAEKVGPEAAAKYQKLLENKKLLLYIGIGAAVVSIAITILICIKRKAISVAAGVIEVAADYIFDHPMLFVIMLICFVFQIISFIGCLFGLVVIHTTGHSKTENKGFPYPVFEYDAKKWAMMVFFGIGTYWMTVFWNNVCDFTVSAAAVDDYFKKDVGTIGEFIKAFTVHMGTVAYGSLVLGPIGVFNLLFGWLHALVRDDEPNIFQKALGFLCCLCCWPYEKLCLRIDDNAFAMVALTQLNFCPSGKKNFYLNRRIGEKLGDASIIGFLFGLCGRIGIASLTTWIAYMIFSKVAFFHERLHNVLVPTLAVFLTSIVVSQLVMNMFSTACDATLMCYLVQLDTGAPSNYSELDEKIKNINNGYGNLN